MGGALGVVAALLVLTLQLDLVHAPTAEPDTMSRGPFEIEEGETAVATLGEHR